MLKPKLVTLALAVTLGTLATGAHAHQLWLERDAAGTVRVYVGDADDSHDKGEEVAKLAATTQVFAAGKPQPLRLVVHGDHLEVPAPGAGDLRLFNDRVWKPWTTKEGALKAAVFSAREGRSDTGSVLDYEFAPVVAQGNRFTLRFKGQPLAGKTVTVVNADKWTRRIKTDAQGQLEVPVKAAGRYILVAAHSVDEARDVEGQKVAKVDYTTTLSFVAQ